MWVEHSTTELLKENTDVCCKSSNWDFVTYFCGISSGLQAGCALSYDFDLKRVWEKRFRLLQCKWEWSIDYCGIRAKLFNSPGMTKLLVPTVWAEVSRIEVLFRARSPSSSSWTKTHFSGTLAELRHFISGSIFKSCSLISVTKKTQVIINILR